MAQPGARRRGRRRGGDEGEGTGRAAAPLNRLTGGRLNPLDADAITQIDAAARAILAEIGMAAPPEDVVGLVTAAGGDLSSEGRLLFPRDLQDSALAGIGREVALCGRRPGLDLHLAGRKVHVGTGGASPQMVDLHSGAYRPSTLADLYDAARLVDVLDNIHFFARPVVARDMDSDLLLEINTAYAALAGTAKHVVVSASSPEAVRAIADLCFAIAGSADAFRDRPFLSLTINHVVPPLRFSAEACDVMIEAARLGLPMQCNTFGQLGASSPVTIAGCVAQTIAETLAGVIVAWLANPQARIIFGPRPMVTDLRTGGMAGGCGEQALLTAVAVRMAQHYGLPNSTIAGATDSKVPDGQAGFEKSLTVSMAAQTGSNMITQAAGALAGLMACSLEAYVIDNDMLGVILRSLAPIELDDTALSVAAIAEVARGEGHFLGQPETYQRMQSDFLYPDVSDRRSPEDWAIAGSPDIRNAAKARAQDTLATHYPNYIPEDIDADLRDRFDIRLPKTCMRPS
ncbi:trimethylamine methyltransferase family protein [Nioella aestuarii]|uniref:trimethylamine methyltransferase family protein n=1 Tax=Nioella aestuarii TaxID=1662864 RepID=UPI003D7FB6DD